MKIIEILFILSLVFYRSNQENTLDNTDLSDPVTTSDISDSYPTTMQYNNTDYSPTKIILIGFENYKINKNNNITFNVIFKKIYGNIFPENLLITLNIFNGMLRNLKEEKETIKCPINKSDEGINKLVE